MADGSKSLWYEITGENSSFVKAMEGCATATTSASKQIDAQFKRIGDAFSMVQKQFVVLTAVIAGGGALKEFIKQANDWNGAAGKMAGALGITVQQASVLNVALARAGVDQEVYTGAVAKMAAKIHENAKAFEVLGVQVRDSNGAYRPASELLGEVNTKLAAIKNPIEQAIAGQRIYGESWNEVKGVLKITQAAMQDAEDRARKLGLIVGPEGVAASKQYGQQMRDLGLVGKSLEIQFGQQLLPVFAKTGAWMAEEGPTMGRAFGAVLTFLVEQGIKVYYTFKALGELISGVLAAAALAITGDFRSAGIALGKMVSDVDALGDKANAALEKFRSTDTAGVAGPDLTAGPRYDFKPDSDKKGTDEGRMPGWEAALEEKKLKTAEASRAEGVLREMSKAEELKYWDDIRARTDLTEKERVAVRRKSAALGLDVLRGEFDARMEQLRMERDELGKNHAERSQLAVTAFQETVARYGAESKEAKKAYADVLSEHRAFIAQRRQLDEIAADIRRADRTAGIEMQRLELQEQASLGVLTNAQVLEQERQLQEQLHNLRLEALVERRALIDPDRDPVAYAQANQQILEQERQHQLRMAQIKTQTLMEQRAPLLQAMGSIEQTWAGLIQKLATGTLTIGGFIRGMFQAVSQAVVQMLAQMAARWMMQKAALLVFDKATGLSEIATESAKAGAGGVASMAAAPFPLNLTAPAFGAAMATAAMAFAPVASASGGYDIPAGVNPVTQLHAREMVLPERHADVIRSLEGLQTSAQASGPVYIATTGGDFIHKRDLAALLKKLGRDFAFV